MVGANLRGIPAACSCQYNGFLYGLALRTDLELCQAETATSTYSSVVLDAGAAYDRSELVDRAGCYLSSFGDTRIATGLLATRL